jgi:hypothetical protein
VFAAPFEVAIFTTGGDQWGRKQREFSQLEEPTMDLWKRQRNAKTQSLPDVSGWDARASEESAGNSRQKVVTNGSCCKVAAPALHDQRSMSED